MARRTIAVVAGVALVGLGLVAVPSAVGASAAAPTGIHKIKHVIVIMQENRSFDSYFGTFPGADGIPMRRGVPTVCVPDSQTGECVKPYAARPKGRELAFSMASSTERTGLMIAIGPKGSSRSALASSGSSVRTVGGKK